MNLTLQEKQLLKRRKHIEENRRVEARWIRRGLCVRCGKPKYENKYRCERCLTLDAQWIKRKRLRPKLERKLDNGQTSSN